MNTRMLMLAGALLAALSGLRLWLALGALPVSVPLAWAAPCRARDSVQPLLGGDGARLSLSDAASLAELASRFDES